MQHIRMPRHHLAGAVGPLAMVMVACPAQAQQAASQRYDLPSQPLGDALRAVALASGTNVIASTALVDGKLAPALSGRFTVIDAVSILLRGSGLRIRAVGAGLIVERDEAITGATDPSAVPDQEIVVTGSRIRGARVTSPVITVSRENARNAGQATLGEIVRSIPQSFGGGQNPGIGFNVPAINGVDTGGASSINLRGLGSDATLTLLNGRRLAYSGTRQSVDVSSIPLGALDRIEIVPDGASALYGSDAVGGVANIILRRDMTGIETRARIGGSTDGGNFQQQYGATGGARWSSGGFIAALEINRATAIDFDDRSYAVTRSPGLRLLPSARNENALVSGHQSLSETLEFSMDALFNVRSNLFIYPQNPVGNLAVSRSEQNTKETAFALSPVINLSLGEGARISLSGTYAEDRVRYRNRLITPAATTVLVDGCYCNRTTAIELSGDGRLFQLPGGWARAAVGIGYRNTQLRSDRGAGDALNFDRSQPNGYAYGEVNLPIVSPETGIAGIARLSGSGAIRYEHYRGIGEVATPRLGLIYAPVPWLDLRGSWGRSFRSPTLLQQFQPPILNLFPATTLGGTGFPATATVLLAQGGNPTLKPERASSWSLSAVIRPPALPGLKAEFSYFSTRYTDRIVAPIAFITQSLSNPVNAAWVIRSPSPSVLAARIAAGGVFSNSTGAAYNPANVVALVDNSNVNAGRQPIHGVDALLAYRDRLGSDDDLTLEGNVSYLVSRRQISRDQPELPLAGILFNPPHWRGRATAGWRHGGWNVSTTANYLGSLRDTRRTPSLRIPSRTTFDLAIRYRSSEAAPPLLRGIDVIVSAQNLFAADPPPIVTGPVTDTPYDSTNYSAVGRFVAVTVAKKW